MMDIDKIVLGTVMVRPELAPEVMGELDVKLFLPELRDLYAALDGLWSATGKLDAVAAFERYPALKPTIVACLEAVDVSCVCITRERVREWVRLLKERRALERFQALAIEAAGGATAYADLPGLYDRMGRALDLEDGGEDSHPIGDLVDDYIRRLDEKPRYIPTGIGILDRYLHLSQGNFLLIGGRPSAGKTALSLQMAVEQAMRGYRVCYFSLETSAEVLTLRIIANRLGVPLADVQAKRVPPAALDGLARLRQAPLDIQSAAGKSVGWMRAQAARKKAQVVYVDYVQIIPSDGRDRYTQITRSSIALHELAQTTGMVVVGVAQLNRSAAHADPTTADLKESGQLEQDADAIILLGGPGSEHPFALAKNKEGRTGDFHVMFNKEKQRFLEVTP